MFLLKIAEESYVYRFFKRSCFCENLCSVTLALTEILLDLIIVISCWQVIFLQLNINNSKYPHIHNFLH